MGLDVVEFIMAVEDAFGLAIPDAEAEQLTSPGRLIDYLAARLPTGGAAAAACLSQRAFYKLRRATCIRLGTERGAVRTDTPLSILFAGQEGERAWQDVQIEVGAAHWPRLGRKPLFDQTLAPHLATFGEVAAFLVTRCPVAVQEDGPGWTRSQIADVVGRLIREELEIEEYTESSEWGRDLGLD
ncbi:MAG TPA: acyl carrier protein [Gemmatimonadaceae bacterium]|nr:acyl carrier protein [Gemmatimonadaceae bacterium]